MNTNRSSRLQAEVQCFVPPELLSDNENDENPPKRSRMSHSLSSSTPLGSLDLLPPEIVQYEILPFLSPHPLTYMELQLTCKVLYKWCHSVEVKRSLQLIGNKDCILHRMEWTCEAITHLFEFAKCGNIHAEHM